VGTAVAYWHEQVPGEYFTSMMFTSVVGTRVTISNSGSIFVFGCVCNTVVHIGIFTPDCEFLLSFCDARLLVRDFHVNLIRCICFYCEWEQHCAVFITSSLYTSASQCTQPAYDIIALPL